MGFRNFIHGLGQSIATSLFEEWKSEEEEKQAKAARESFIATQQGAFGRISGAARTMGFDPFSTYRDALAVGQSRVAFQISKAFAPILNEMRWASNRHNLATGDIYRENPEGVAIGSTIGGIVGGVVGAAYPILIPLIPLFEWSFGYLGAGIESVVKGTTPLIWNWGGTMDNPLAPDYGEWDPTGGQNIWTEPEAPPPRIIPGLSPGARKLTMLELNHWI